MREYAQRLSIMGETDGPPDYGEMSRRWKTRGGPAGRRDIVRILSKMTIGKVARKVVQQIGKTSGAMVVVEDLVTETEREIDRAGATVPGHLGLPRQRPRRPRGRHGHTPQSLRRPDQRLHDHHHHRKSSRRRR